MWKLFNDKLFFITIKISAIKFPTKYTPKVNFEAIKFHSKNISSNYFSRSREHTKVSNIKPNKKILHAITRMHVIIYAGSSVALGFIPEIQPYDNKKLYLQRNSRKRKK